MRPRDIKSFLRAALQEPVHTPPIHIWGQPGIGKSQIVKEVANEEEVDLIDIRLAQRDATDLRGIPAIVDGKAVWLAPAELPTDPDWHGFVLYNELTSAPPLVQAAAYQAILDRKISLYSFPKGAYQLAAGNRQEDRAVVFRMSTALANRFIHIDFEVNIDDWIDWAMSHTINPNIIAYIKWKGDALCPKFDPDASEKAFTTPRTWEFASRVLAMAEPRLVPTLLEGTIGRGQAATFMSFLKLQTELPNLDDIMSGKSDFVPIKNDLRFAIVGGLVARVKQDIHYERLLVYSNKLPVEFAVMMIQMLAAKNDVVLGSAPSWDSWARKNSDVLLPRKIDD